MGQVIYLDERRSPRKPAKPLTTDITPVFFFDVSSPLSYLVAERVERRLGEVEWVPVSGSALRRGPETGGDGRAARREEQALRVRAESCARALRLPLVWPERFPADAPCIQRAAAFACEIGAGAAFALAASRLAFCGGFDVEDPETLAEAAAAAGVPLNECLAAAGDTGRDEELEATADELRARGISELPAIRLGDRWLHGEAALLDDEALLHAPHAMPRAHMRLA